MGLDVCLSVADNLLQHYGGAVPARLQKMVDDKVLTDFIFNDRRYKTDELVGIVKKIKHWGSNETEGGA